MKKYTGLELRAPRLGALKNPLKKSTLAIASLSLLFAGIPAVAFGSAEDITGSPRLEQPSCSYTFQDNELAVVNFAPKWGDKDANVASMVKYIEDAAAKGTKILVFPEMCVTGYASSSDPDSETYKMPIRLAEDLNGPTQKKIAALADKYDMWIIYGGTQKVYKDNGKLDTEHAYNSAFACGPDGDTTAYQKITPVEGSWCKSGETPVLLDAGEYGKIGLSICYDTYATPELGRYYAAQGANILVNPTATSRSYSKDNDKGWEWYYQNRIESCASREGYTILSADLVGEDGPTTNGKQAYLFPGGSVICKGSFNGAVYYAGVAEDQLGTAQEDADITTGVEGVQYNVGSVKCSTGSTCTNKDFNPEEYAQLYAELADEQESGSSLSYSYTDTDGPRSAVVNMTGKWGDINASMEIMDKYVEEAAEKGVEILVFPEMALQGYQYVKPADGEQAMQVKLAQSKDGAVAKHYAELAKKHNMYIIYGASEMPDGGPIVENGKEKVYNSAFICAPDGTVDTYQKMHRAGSEDQWSVCGTTPKMFTIHWTKDGFGADDDPSNDIKVGIDICRDGHFYPELGRYYAAQGCTLFIHPTATTGNAWYRETRIGSYTDRDGMAAITCNLLGVDGPTDSTGALIDAANGYTYNSTSLIITKYHDATTGRTSWNKETGYAIDLNGTGSASEGYAERKTSPAGLEIADMNLSGTGFRISNFKPRLFSKMYDKLAQLYRGGYTSMYSADEQVKEPVTKDLTSNLTVTASKKSVKTGKKATVTLKTKVGENAKVTYELVAGKAKFAKVSKAGKVTFTKKAKKGTYKIKVTAAATAHYKAESKTITLKVA